MGISLVHDQSQSTSKHNEKMKLAALMALSGFAAGKPSMHPSMRYRSSRKHLPSPYYRYPSRWPSYYPEPPQLPANKKAECRKVFQHETDSSATSSAIRIIMILDETGSMSSYKDVTISSFNEFLQTQKQASIPTRDCDGDRCDADKFQLSVVKFDTKHSELHYSDLESAKPLTSDQYSPGGMTALYDAMGCTFDRYAEEFENIVVVITDGEDNSSRIYDHAHIKQLVKELESKNNWTVRYIGANQDPMAVARKIGVSSRKVSSYSFNNRGIQDSYKSISKSISHDRSLQQLARYNRLN